MYSVIIQNGLTTESFLEHNPLFIEALKKDEIGICRWNESGTTIDTALPDIRELTDDKEEWRAIVVRFEDEAAMEGFGTDPRNPFDFVEKDNWDEQITESKNPFIRLTHMLGGVPAPEKSFEANIFTEEYMQARTIYEPVPNYNLEESHRKLSRKYEIDGVKPNTIILISVRRAASKEEVSDSTWQTFHETQSSEFWKRNHYPSNCRFLVYDFKSRGPVQRVADEFGFWSSVMMIANNTIDSSSLQAYRLYRLRTRFDKDLLQEKLQQNVDKMRLCRKTLKDSMKKTIGSGKSKHVNLPDYETDIEVDLEIPTLKGSAVKPETFKTLSKSASSDIAVWNTNKRKAEEAIARSLKEASRSLDRAAEEVREASVVDEALVKGLSRYEREDLTEEVESLYQDIVELQSVLPSANIEIGEGTEEASDRVVDYMRRRITRSDGMKAILGAGILALLTLFPAFIAAIAFDTGSIIAAYLTALIVIVPIPIAALIVLLLQRSELKRRIIDYNNALSRTLSKLRESKNDFGEYVSLIASHARGCSYLDLSLMKDAREDDLKKLKVRHLHAIDVYMTRLHDWAKAFHVRLDDNNVLFLDEYRFDIYEPPAENLVYTFDTGGKYPVELNKTGFTIDSPFDFINKVEIIREELYDELCD